MPTADTTLQIPSNVTVLGDLAVTGVLPAYARASLLQDDFQSYPLPVSAWRQHDAYGTALTTTPSSDDLGVAGGTFGTDVPYITAGDIKTTSGTRYARLTFQLPPEYVAGQSVRIAVNGGCLTTAADTTANVTVEAYKSARTTAKTGSNLVTTAAQSIKSTTFSTVNFDLTSTSLSPGDILDIRLGIVYVDAATGTAVKPSIADVTVLLDVKG